MKQLLFLCTGNSCRSQMAEGWARHLGAGVVEAWSAGTAPKGLDARAVRAMAESGIDISGQASKPVGALAGEAFDLVVTVCDSAAESCPVFPGPGERLHRSFDDPRAWRSRRRVTRKRWATTEGSVTRSATS